MLDAVLLLLNALVLMAVIVAFLSIIIFGARYAMRPVPTYIVEPKKPVSIFEEVAIDHNLDPRKILRSDTEFFDKIEEYHHGITG
jgi:hypothetical protein